MLCREFLGIIAGMGTGKTATALTATSDMLDFGDVERVLIVAPKRVAETVWAQEAAEWEHLKHLTFAKVMGTPQQRLKALRSDAQLYIVNRENFVWLLRLLDKRPGFFDMLIIDEASMFKDPTTIGFKELKKRVHYFKRRFLLTGTPRPNGAQNLWPLSYILDQGQRLGSSFYRFRETYMYKPFAKSYDWLMKPNAEETITNRISDMLVRIDAKDYLEMPELLKLEHHVQLTAGSRKVYNAMEAQLVASVASGRVTAANVAVSMGKCHQIAGGAVYGNEDDGSWDDIHDTKIEALKELVEELDSNVLVSYWYGHELTRLQKAFPGAPHLGSGLSPSEFERIKNEWNAKKHRVLFVHPQSVGHGQNLQFGGRDLIFYTLSPSLELHDQIIARIGPERRAGEKEPTRIHYILAEDTVDFVYKGYVEGKAKGQTGLLDALRDYTQRTTLAAA